MTKFRGLLLVSVLAWSVALTLSWGWLHPAELADAASPSAPSERPAQPIVLAMGPDLDELDVVLFEDSAAEEHPIEVAALQPTVIVPAGPVVASPEEGADPDPDDRATEPENAAASAAARATASVESSDHHVANESPEVDHESAKPEPKAIVKAKPLTPELIRLRKKVNSALQYYYTKSLNIRENDPWQVMHGIISYGVNANLYRSGNSGPTVNAIAWMCSNGALNSERMLYVDHGQLVARKGPGLQGHYGQLLAILAQSYVKIDYPMTAGGKKFTVRDFVEHEKSDCETGTELTFKLIGLMHYLDSDEIWTTRDGQEWSISKLIREEIKQPIRGAACGGTHRLMGLSYAVNKRIKRGKPVDGEFLRAQTFINQYHRYTFSLQNKDGSFSTEWFTRPAAKEDVDRRLKTTGHITEWLSFSLSDDDLRNPKMVQAVDYLATILLNDKTRKWEVGPVGHGLHALALYDERVFKPADVVDAAQKISPKAPSTKAPVAKDIAAEPTKPVTKPAPNAATKSKKAKTAQGPSVRR